MHVRQEHQPVFNLNAFSWGTYRHDDEEKEFGTSKAYSVKRSKIWSTYFEYATLTELD